MARPVIRRAMRARTGGCATQVVPLMLGLVRGRTWTLGYQIVPYSSLAAVRCLLAVRLCSLPLLRHGRSGGKRSFIRGDQESGPFDDGSVKQRQRTLPKLGGSTKESRCFSSQHRGITGEQPVSSVCPQSAGNKFGTTSYVY
ncbi:hypothetical protein LY76DRAFT_353757 [Colletotrichum caudatum]|nr:hypothetical protein LY76DRAFT_353757 [Colletotrichum caudatum]